MKDHRLALALLSTSLLVSTLLFLKFGWAAVPTPVAALAESVPDQKAIPKLRRELVRLQPRGLYIVIDTGANRLFVKKGDQILLDAICSTGSGRRLIAGDREWTFETPRGEFSIINKVANPVWRKPDWAFLEEGEPVPVQEGQRYETGVLGEYALGFGDGYFIHGTLYTRLLGHSVTHGCVRLGSKDLINLNRMVSVGTKVLIY